MNLNLNYLVSSLAIVLALGVYNVLIKYGTSWKISLGAALLSIILVGIFWTGVYLGAHDDDDD